MYLLTLVRFLSYLYILVDNDIGISAFRPLLLWEPRLQSRVLLAGSEGPKESELWSRLLLCMFDLLLYELTPQRLNQYMHSVIERLAGAVNFVS